MVEADLRGPVPAWVQTLALAAWEQRLLLCAGAGVSMPDPTGLPSGDEVAKRLARQLHDLSFDTQVEACTEGDLMCLADEMEKVEGGKDLLQELLPTTADYQTASPNSSHAVLALLVVDELATLALTNWDTCVERISPHLDVIQVVVSDADHATMKTPRLFKIHGDTARRGTLLVSSADLSEPPTWVFHELGARLGDSRIVFLGLGSIPRYVRVRVEQLIQEIGTEHVNVVAKHVGPEWTELLGEGGGGHVIDQTADEFLEDLLKGLIAAFFMKVLQRASEHDQAGHFTGIGVNLTDRVTKTAAAFENSKPADVLEWMRIARAGWPPGESVLRSHEARRGVLALALLADEDLSVLGEGLAQVGERVIAVLLTRGMVSADVVREGTRRIETARSENGIVDERVWVLCCGHEGPLPSASNPRSILEETPSDNLVDGPPRGVEVFLSADHILDGQIPEGWTT
jgi:hypothetical protein